MEKATAIVEETYVYDRQILLTVHKTSVFFPGDGFIAYDSTGKIAFRVESYTPVGSESGEIVLMNAVGRCILTVHRKRPSLHHRRNGFIGEGVEGKNPIFSVHRSSIISQPTVTVEVYSDPSEEYQIKGSFACRECSIMKGDKVVAEIRRKVDPTPTKNVVLGKDVFVLCVKPGFDSAFAMGVILALDQIDGAADDCNSDCCF